MYVARALSICLFTIAATGLVKAHEIGAKTTAEIMHLIRSEKFDLILPEAMRDNGVDMWIHATRVGRPDPMRVYFGSVDGYIIFTDRGGERIERAVLGNRNRSQNIRKSVMVRLVGDHPVTVRGRTIYTTYSPLRTA